MKRKSERKQRRQYAVRTRVLDLAIGTLRAKQSLFRINSLVFYLEEIAQSVARLIAPSFPLWGTSTGIAQQGAMPLDI